MNARDWALFELDSRRLPDCEVGVLPGDVRDRNPPTDSRDLALAERITTGVIKNHLLLMHLVRHYSGRALNQIDSLVLKILEIGLYQLRCLDRIPPSAAVDEAVEQCRRFGRARAAGFVNAILRNATRQPDIDLPDSRTDPEPHASIALSHPPELFRRLTSIMSVEDALRFCRHNNDEPPTLVRLLRGASVEQLTSDGVTITPHEQPGMFLVQHARRAILESWAQRGLAQAQDATAASVVPRMEIQPGQRLLDRCSGMGTKTLQMREYLGSEGSIIAIDPSGPRCDALREILQVRKIENVQVHQVSMLRQVAGLNLPMFDRVLLDVPCSNSGVLARRAEARYAQDQRSLDSLVKLQRDIVDDTAEYLSPGGVLVYSTCSVWPRENKMQVEKFLSRNPDYTIVDSFSELPSFDSDPTRYHDGGFIAVLRRT